jgi:hypothetical protein
VKISKTAVTQTASGFEQELSYTCNGKLRREIFVGRTADELKTSVEARLIELRTSP